MLDSKGFFQFQGIPHDAWIVEIGVKSATTFHQYSMGHKLWVDCYSAHCYLQIMINTVKSRKIILSCWFDIYSACDDDLTLLVWSTQFIAQSPKHMHVLGPTSGRLAASVPAALNSSWVSAPHMAKDSNRIIHSSSRIPVEPPCLSSDKQSLLEASDESP